MCPSLVDGIPEIASGESFDQNKDIEFCFDTTAGFPFLVQLLFSTMYQAKLRNPDPAVYLSETAKQYNEKTESLQRNDSRL